MYSTCVRLVPLGNRKLSDTFQAELAIDTNIRVADTQTVVTDTRMTVANTQTAVTETRTMVADTQATVSNTEAMVADIHRNILTGQNSASVQNNCVGES